MKTLKKIMINNTFTNMSSLDLLREEMFPLVYTPFLKGVVINIQKGHILLAYNDVLVINFELKDKLKKVREKTIKNKYVITATLKSKKYGDEYLINCLLQNYGKLPADLEVHFTEIVVNDAIKEMTRNMRDANMWLAGYGNDIENVFFHKHCLVNSMRMLKQLISPLLFNEIYDGITIHKPQGKYEEGFNRYNFDSVNIDYSREVNGIVRMVYGDLAKIGKSRNKLKNVIRELQIELPNGDIITHSLEELNLLDRSMLWENKGCLFDANVKLLINEIPLLRTPIIKKIISIDPI